MGFPPPAEDNCAAPRGAVRGIIGIRLLVVTTRLLDVRHLTSF